MKRLIFLALMIASVKMSMAQCTTGSLNISTGYDPISGALTTPPVIDPKWTSTVSAAAATAIAGDGLILGCYDIVPLSLWSMSPTCRWISAQNAWGYNTTGPGPDIFWMTLTRPISLCTADSIRLNLSIATDDGITEMYFDGNPVYTHTFACSMTGFITYTFNLGWVTAGTHTFSVVIHNCNNGVYVNATGMALNGTASSTTGHSSLNSESSIICIPTVVVMDSTICPGSPITLHADTAGSGFVWSNGDTTSYTVVSSTGTYWVNFSTGPCMLRTDSIHVTTNVADTTINGHNIAVCGGSVTLHGLPGYSSYQWSNGSTDSVITVSASGTYSVIVSDCITAMMDTFHVIISPPISIALGNDTAICSGNQIVLSSVQPTGTVFQWSTGSTTDTIHVSSTGTYWLTANNGCTATDTIRVTVKPSPNVNIGGDTTFCTGIAITLSSPQPAGNTFTWSTGSTAPSIVVSTTGTYWLRVSENGCTVTDSIHVLVNPFPAIVTLGPDTTNCDGGPVILQSSTVYAAPVYLWSTGSTASSISVSINGTYWLQVTDASCPGRDTVQVTIVNDTLNLFNRDTAICMGQIVQVLANANPLATYQWLPTAGIAAPNVIAPTITPDTSAMYYVVVNMTGCPPKTDSFYIDVQPIPQFYLGGSRFVCAFDTVHMAAFVIPGWYNGYIYSWSPATSLDNNTGRTVVFTAGATQTYVLTVITPAGCIGIDSSRITVYPGNFAGTIPDQNICPRDSLQLLATGGVSYHWYPSMGVSDVTSSAPWIFPVASQNYSVVVTSTVGCTDTILFNVTVWPAGVISLADSVTLYPGETYHITPVTNCTSFTWFPYSGVSNPLVSDPTFSPPADTRYIIYGTTEHGCKASDSISVYVSSESLVDVPNAFTPGNGTNNVFSFINRGIVAVNHFRVFNRWGNMVFETNSMNKGWDGSYKGEPQPFGVYVYDIQVVTPTGRIVNKHGNVTLLR